MAVKRSLGLLKPEELAQLSEADRKLIRDRIISELNDKKIKAMIMRDFHFEALIGGLSPKIKNRLKAKVRPLVKRLQNEPVEAHSNVTKLRKAGAD